MLDGRLPQRISGITQPKIEVLYSLAPGDRVEVHGENGRPWQGTVDLTAAGLGILWIRTDADERKIIDIQEHNIRQIPQTEG
ncbi:hypothetical protein GCM10009825_12320 [Arthrobacter humicola]|uniref:Uncharacterized protein n=1 Tax=Arthrobacter humicola TaxID=409291 RepID=A0ABN2YRX7_9MICC